MRVLLSTIVLASALLVLAGCGTRVIQSADPTVSGLRTRLVIVESKSVVPPDDPAQVVGIAAAADLEKRVIAELGKRGVAALSVTSAKAQRQFGAAETALLALSITRAEEGSAAKRLLVGFGYGKSHLEVEARLLAPSHMDEQVLASFRTKAGSGYKPGVLMPLGVGAAAGGYVLATSGLNLATGLTRTPDRNLQATARAIAKTVARSTQDK